MVYTLDEVAEKLAPIQPSNGMSAWKKPKASAIISIGRSRTRFNMMPLAIDTAKQSIASPIASSQISNPVIVLEWKFISYCIGDTRCVSVILAVARYIPRVAILGNGRAQTELEA